MGDSVRIDYGCENPVGRRVCNNANWPGCSSTRPHPPLGANSETVLRFPLSISKVSDKRRSGAGR